MEGLSAHLEETKGLDVVSSIESKAVVDTGREDDEILGLNGDTDPAGVGRVCVA